MAPLLPTVLARRSSASKWLTWRPIKSNGAQPHLPEASSAEARA
jgi:hypothetical protein